jgi:hypothetical protein
LQDQGGHPAGNLIQIAQRGNLGAHLAHQRQLFAPPALASGVQPGLEGQRRLQRQPLQQVKLGG